MTEQLLVLSEGDDVAITLGEVPAGASLDAPGGAPLTAPRGIPRGHKVALRTLAEGTLVTKYGHVIGVATADIAAGEHVHVHNLAMPQDAGTLSSGGAGHGSTPELPADLRRTFQGYRRADGRVGTRNYVGVLTTVNCSATVARQVVRRTEDDDRRDARRGRRRRRGPDARHRLRHGQPGEGLGGLPAHPARLRAAPRTSARSWCWASGARSTR